MKYPNKTELCQQMRMTDGLSGKVKKALVFGANRSHSIDV